MTGQLAGTLEHAVDRFAPVSLEELDERASLLRRVDHKYALDRARFVELLRRVQDDHQILEIDGTRVFNYCSTYFDTPDLRCFTDHAESRQPRFKTRTRLYEDSGACVFEVKLKRETGELDKRQIDHPVEEAGQFTDAARNCLQEALRDAGLQAPEHMSATLRTRFGRITLVARDTPERLTCDLDVELSSAGGDTAAMRAGMVVIESKSERGESPADRLLAGAGIQPISLSKYRVGIGLVGPGERGPQPGSDLFERRAGR